ncbi:MAG: AEC family transporter [Neomegalonema sp.]|nr:AEC family transporter [Neomegalonema sp.]
MLAILQVVLPVFLLIGTGYGAVRLKLFPDSGIDGLIAFVVRFATPFLLFSAMARLHIAEVFNLGMIIAFYTGALSCFALGLMMARLAGRTPGEAVTIGFACLFSNTVLVGLPIMLRAYGEAATAPAYAIISLHAPVLYSLGMIAMEVSRRDGAGAWVAMRRSARSVLSNALMLGIFAGLALNASGLTLPEPVMAYVEMLARATLPTALFALGAAMTRYRLASEISWALIASVLLLFVHPAIAWLVATQLLDLPHEFARVAVIVAAMPAGLNVYVFASMYKRAEGIAASTVILSTALSVLTISFWLAVMGGAE